MASVKFRRRKSQAADQPGRLYVQVIQRRVVATLALPFRLYEEEWNNKAGRIIYPQDSTEEKAQELTGVMKYLGRENEIWKHILAGLEKKGGDYTARDIIDAYKRSWDVTLLTSVAARKIWELRKVGALTTAYNYLGVVKRFLRFVGHRELHVQDFTGELLVRFSDYLEAKGVSRNTTSFYFRILRALWKFAINKGLIPMKPSPFHGIFMGVEKTSKRAVKEAIINELMALSDLSEGLDFARCLFLFSFCTRGMAFVDLAHLTQDNIQGEYLVYTRQKCGCELRIKLVPWMLDFIKRHKDNGTPFLFPILKSANPTLKNYQSALRLQNKRLKTLAVLLNRPDLKLTTYVARHSWASIAHEKGVEIEVISHALGHTSLTTTYIYIATLDNGKVDEANELVLKGNISQMNEQLWSHD